MQEQIPQTRARARMLEKSAQRVTDTASVPQQHDTDMRGREACRQTHAQKHARDDREPKACTRTVSRWAMMFGIGLGIGLVASSLVRMGGENALVAWSAAQLVTSMWPWAAPQTRAWEERAWRHWEETEGSRSLVPPLSVPELPHGAKPASLQAPFVVRGLLNGSRALDGFGGVSWLRTPPVADLVVDYFSNASARMAVVPDSRGRLGDVVERILAGGPQKLGTEMIFREQPHRIRVRGQGARRMMAAPLARC